jgi:hypothetical protein
MTIDKPGIYQISNEAYHRDPCVVPSLSRGTIADLINTTPQHAAFYHPRLNPDFVQEDKDVFDIGKAAHALFLEGLDCAEVCDFPNWQTKAAKEAKEAARLAGKTPLLAHQYERVQEMVKAAHSQLAASELGIKNLHMEGDSEQTYIWEENGTWFRVRPDWISQKKIGDRKLILDYKTTGESADPAAFKATAYGKDIQHALYRRGVKAIEGGNSPRFLFLVQETFPPYLCSFIGLDPQTAEIGKQKVEFGKFMWEKCLATGEWPGYPQRVCYVEVKPWEVAAWEAKSAEIGVE